MKDLTALKADLAAKEKEYEIKSQDTSVDPKVVKDLQREIELLREDIAYAEEQAAAKTAKYEVDKDLAKKTKELKEHDSYFKQAAAKFPGEVVTIQSFKKDVEAGQFVVVLNAEKKGLRKVSLPIAEK